MPGGQGGGRRGGRGGRGCEAATRPNASATAADRTREACTGAPLQQRVLWSAARQHDSTAPHVRELFVSLAAQLQPIS